MRLRRRADDYDRWAEHCDPRTSWWLWGQLAYVLFLSWTLTRSPHWRATDALILAAVVALSVCGFVRARRDGVACLRGHREVLVMQHPHGHTALVWADRDVDPTSHPEYEAAVTQLALAGHELHMVTCRRCDAFDARADVLATRLRRSEPLIRPTRWVPWAPRRLR